MSEYFHFTMMRLAPGSTIECGNWGRLLRKYENDTVPGRPLFGNSWILARELTFEVVRLRDFQSKPTRWDASFCLLTQADADAYRTRFDVHKTQVLHKVTIVDEEAKTHIGSLEMIAYPPPLTSFIDVTTERAKNYWSGQGDGLREMIVHSALRVTECLG